MTADVTQRLQQLLGTVIGRLAHDLKNPLAVVLSNVQYLEEEMPPGDAADALAETAQSAELLQAMLDDAVDALRIGAGAYVPSSRPTQLSELAHALDRQLAGRLGSRTLHVDLPERAVDTDGDLLRRAMCALLEHAVRQSPPGAEVRLEGRVDDGVLALQVVDAGPPFDPSRTPTFLAPDFSERAQSPDHRSDRGLGLGFAGTALRALGASLDITARPDGEQGARFVISLPLAEASR